MKQVVCAVQVCISQWGSDRIPCTLDSEEEPFVREMAKRRNALSQAGVENPAPGRRIGTDSH